ncbi:antitoxin component of MazEF toxin-antitoxin module [Bradyrhizobium sp. USDA 4354]
MRISKWRKSLALQFPGKLLEKLGVGNRNDRAVALGPHSDEQFLCQLRALQRPRPKDFVWKRDNVGAR